MENTTPVAEQPEAKMIDQELVDRLTKEYEAHEKDLKNKVYPMKLENKEVFTRLTQFINEEAEWSNMEALGIIEVSKALARNLERQTGSGNFKDQTIFFKNLEIEAISFFLRKAKGNGIESAEEHLSLIRPINDSLRLIKADNDRLMQIQSELAAAENGLALDTSAEDAKKKNG